MLPGDLSSPLFELVDDCDIRIALEEGNYEWANSRATRLNPSWRRVVLQTKVALAQDRVRDAERLLADSGFSPGSRRDHIRVNVLQARCATSDREEGTATTFLLEATDIAESNQLLQCLLEEVRTCPGAMYGALSTRPGAFRRRVLDALDRPAVARIHGPSNRPVARPAQPQRGDGAGLPGITPHPAGDRGRALHLGQHFEDSCEVDLPEARRRVTQRGHRAGKASDHRLNREGRTFFRITPRGVTTAHPDFRTLTEVTLDRALVFRSAGISHKAATFHQGNDRRHPHAC